MLVMITIGTTTAWAQTDFTGIWYIANETNHGNATISTHWYLVPGKDPQQSHYADAYFNNQYCNTSGKGDYKNDNYGDPEKPFLTTYQTSQDLNSVWILVSTGDDCYNIIHAKTGKYVVYEPPYKEAPHRKSVHLESTDSPGENAKFTISGNSLSGPININPKSVTADNMYFNPAAGVGNRLQYYGTGTYFHEGMIGLWSDPSDKSQWYLENASSALTPVISNVNSANFFSITSPSALFSTIHYTIDGSTTPDANTGTVITSGSDISITGSWSVQAVGIFGTFVTPVAGPKPLTPAPCATPIINYDETTSMVSISCATANTTIYYTTDNSTPTTSSNAYNQPFLATSSTTIKAIATRANFPDSEVGILTISQVATPIIQNNGSNAISITSATPGANIYYTTDGSTPTKSSNPYTEPLRENASGVTIKAIAVKENMITSEVGSGSVTLQCAAPVIIRTSSSKFIITCSLPSSGTTIYYTTNGNTPTTSSSHTTPGVQISCSFPATIKAFAVASNYNNSDVTTTYLNEGMGGDGSAGTPYTIEFQSDVTDFITTVNTVDGASKHYMVNSTGSLDFSGAAAITQSFSGTFDGGNCILTGLTHPLFNTINGGTVKNVMLDNVSISGGTNAGAICIEALGASRIYNCGILATGSQVQTNKDGYTEITNCSSTISGSNYVGGLVGLLDGTSRVINCFSYANITGGSSVGGIVGWNNVATTSANLATMVMNCMFYGDITGGNSKAPIYNGQIITNRSDASGVSNFNYFWEGASYVQEQKIDNARYNCALAAETRFLQRFEFFRPLLNSNRALAAWWVTGDYDKKDEMMKWVMEPSQIGTATPYPILKAPDRYPSVVNIDVNHSVTYKGRDLTVGRKLSTLTVNIQMGSGDNGDTHPNGADITTSSLSLNITDKDPDHFNFNYKKVQLPYYNDVGTSNYTDNLVVTGWKIVTINGGTTDFSTDNDNDTTTPADATASVTNGDITLTTPYNFADRKCTDKDKYSVSGRVFNQGAYFDVPEGVTSITIEPYWGKCVYASDSYPDVVYNRDMSAASNVTAVGGGSRYTNGNAYNINGSSQVVYNTMVNAVTALSPTGTVYDNAIVLVGNIHSLDLSDKTDSKPYTIMSIDLDKDNEPDYSYILRFNSRVRLHPVRVDFLNVIGLGMAQKSNGGTGTYNFGIMQPLGWFEVTNTSLFRVTQFEYDFAGRQVSPMILQGGIIEQWVTVGGTEQNLKEAKSVSYYHVGGNVWFKEFHIGVHQDKTQTEFVSPHPPISVTGGDFDEFYLTGLYNTPNNNYDDNAECYINGGRFGKVAGTGMQGLGSMTNHTNGNIIWQIDNADIDEFYAGGINAAHIAQGSIYTVITNSRVDQFCGGPKFGDMNSDKVVVTNATNCTFRTFFGAGYGGNSYNRRYPKNINNVNNDNDVKWNTWVSGQYTKKYDAAYNGVETRIDYQYLPMSNNTQSVARLFVDYVSFSLATTYDVTSKLTNCTITTSKLGRLDLFEQCLGNFYGGGSLGKVAGPVNSTLTNCTVQGNVFGAGYSATLPKVKVMDNQFQTPPHYDPNLGAYMDAEMPTSEQYDWEHAETVNNNATAINSGSHKLYTTVDLNKSNLGSVSGAVTLTITTTQNGESVIGTSGDDPKGNVYGGGDESFVSNTNPAQAYTTVTISGNTEIKGNVYGGGNRGDVSGSTTVNIQQ